MTQTILVPLDGSKRAERALPEARRIARASDARIVLVRVAPVHSVLRDPLAAQLAAINEAEAYVRTVARSLTGDRFDVATDVFCSDPVEGILIAAMVHRADLIVMGTHGRSGVGRAVLGSVADQVVQAASVPVLLVRGARPTRTTGPYRKIVVPLNGTALAESALRYVAQEAFARHAEVILVETVAPALSMPVNAVAGYAPQSVYEQEAREEAQRQREAQRYVYGAALTYLDERPWQVHVAVGAPAGEILALVREDGVDLIVMATHGRGGFDRLVHGSVAAHVLRHANVPVLLLRGTEVALAPASPVMEDAVAGQVLVAAGRPSDG